MPIAIGHELEGFKSSSNPLWNHWKGIGVELLPIGDAFFEPPGSVRYDELGEAVSSLIDDPNLSCRVVLEKTYSLLEKFTGLSISIPVNNTSSDFSLKLSTWNGDESGGRLITGAGNHLLYLICSKSMYAIVACTVQNGAD
ncbi:hypothetical protein HHK36_023044 [Tetracentron sinense]|uniref:Uncharacterized protein n=1 Tax=Tetracentron sinense TaxID=13715 RepID=A0A834YS68_TETSI|nr:hypothetical protein HHK36_023044 [Tetracentron sinense]